MELESLADISRLARSGQSVLAETIRALLARSSRSSLAGLGLYDESVLLEPLLFSMFTSPDGFTEAIVAQLLASATIRTDKPACVTVDTNDEGIAFLPGLGYLTALRPNVRTDVTVRRTSKSPLEAYFRSTDDEAESLCEPPLRLNGEGVEVLRHSVPLLDQFFTAAHTNVKPGVAIEATAMVGQLAIAFDLLREAWPQSATALDLVLRRIVLFRCESLNSFATTAAHGTVFVNAAHGCTEVFLLEDIVHQAGHVLLASATVDRSWLFNDDPDVLLCGITQTPSDQRTVYVAFHGLVTESMMSVALGRCIESQLLPPGHRFELIGRFTFIFRRFTSDLRAMTRLSIFNPLGSAVVSDIVAAWHALADRFGALADRLDFSNQTYNFNFASFSAINRRELVDEANWTRIRHD